jgi:hypothetical protein
MSAQLPPLKAGQLAFAFDKKSGIPKGFVLTKATFTGTVESRWYIKKLSSKKWELSLWNRRDDKQFVRFEEWVEIEAETEQEAKAKAREYQAQCAKIWNPQEETAFTNVPSDQQERWVVAWIQATKSEWPNLSNVLKGEPVQAALAADLIAHGHNANAVTVITQEICRVAAKTKITASDKLNLWLVANWFHGKKLATKMPQERLESVKENGWPKATLDMIKKRLSRLDLTHR